MMMMATNDKANLERGLDNIPTSQDDKTDCMVGLYNGEWR